MSYEIIKNAPPLTLLSREDWEKDRNTPRVLEPPDFFLDALGINQEAFTLFITQVKKEETRIRRCQKVIKPLTSNQLPNML